MLALSPLWVTLVASLAQASPSAPCLASLTHRGMPVVALTAPSSPVVTAAVSFAMTGLSAEEREDAFDLGVALAEAWRSALPTGTVLPGHPVVTLGDHDLSLSASALPPAARALVSGLGDTLRSGPPHAPPTVAGVRDGRLPPTPARTDAAQGAAAASSPRDLGVTLAKLLVPGRATAVLLGDASPVQLLALLDDGIRVKVPRAGGQSPVSPPPWPSAPTVTELTAPLVGERLPKGLFSWMIFPAPGLAVATLRERAALRTLAGGLGAEVIDGGEQRVLSWQFPLARAEDASATEHKRLERLSNLARGVDAEEARAWAAAALGERLRELRRPESLVRALGLEALSGRACSLHDELAAYDTLTAEELATLARQLADGPRQVVRGVNLPAEGS